MRHATALLESCSYRRVLQRGFALVQNADGHVVTAAAQLHAGERVSLHFADDQVGATIDGSGVRSPAETVPGRAASVRPRSSTRKRRNNPDQGDLL
ncbi:MAG: hypothetical protein HWD60_19675 [Defluviicoccus sp.]|nr:MAG: hypothetical protein HWD60_19675 [Defluviicoccus sp.]